MQEGPPQMSNVCINNLKFADRPNKNKHLTPCKANRPNAVHHIFCISDRTMRPRRPGLTWQRHLTWQTYKHSRVRAGGGGARSSLVVLQKTHVHKATVSTLPVLWTTRRKSCMRRSGPPLSGPAPSFYGQHGQVGRRSGRQPCPSKP
jgi:hypothetical protein